MLRTDSDMLYASKKRQVQHHRKPLRSPGAYSGLAHYPAVLELYQLCFGHLLNNV